MATKRFTDEELRAHKKARSAIYRQENREKIAAYHRQLYVDNKEAIDERIRAYGEKHIKQKADYHRLKTYNLPPERFEQMMIAQDGKCDICGNFLTRPHVDHDHSCCPGKTSCGKCIRSLLCFHCNAGIGHFNDMPDQLRDAADYLEKF